MSSILKALKKIESRKAETQLPTWPYRINNRESMSRHTNRVWRRHKILGILIVVCAVALAGKLYYGNQPDPESMAPKADLSVNTVLPIVSKEKTETDPPEAITDREAAATPVPSSPTVYREDTPQTTLDASPAEAFLKSAVEIPQTTPTADIGLTLQALVWSEQPEDRFVVINDLILREGGAINGSVITRIEPDHVAIRSGETTFHLKYGQ